MSIIDAYLNKVDEPQRRELERVRNIVKQLLPDAEEVISYGMPGFKYKKRYLVGYAAFKDHMSIFPGAAPIRAFQDKLGSFKISKGTIQFTVDNPIPGPILKEIVLSRVADIDKSLS